MAAETVLYEVQTKHEHYQVVDMVYTGRAARLLFSGQRGAAQSAIPLDGNPQMVFDYNQRFLELVEALGSQKILLIGGGAFTLPTQIIQTWPTVTVDVVEQDAQLQKIAQRFFNFRPNKNIKVIIGDGRDYLEHSRQTYDLILLDAFVNNAIPHKLATKEFAGLVARHLAKNGIAAANVISAYHGPNDTVLKQQFATHKTAFKDVGIYPADKLPSYWISQNFILVCSNKLIKPKFNLRFAQLKPPPTDPGDILVDG